jgi:hypothetical protein
VQVFILIALQLIICACMSAGSLAWRSQQARPALRRAVHALSLTSLAPCGHDHSPGVCSTLVPRAIMHLD